MSLFDTIQVFATFPEIEGLSAAINLQKQQWQTKDLNRAMSEYIISEEGRLQRKEYKSTDTGKTYTPSWCKDGDFKMPVIEHEFIGYSDILHHGVLNFYESIPEPNREHFSRWVEFDAYFSYGKLDKIVLKENELRDNTSDLRMKEFFEGCKVRNSKWYFRLVDWLESKTWVARNKIRGFLYWLAAKV